MKRLVCVLAAVLFLLAAAGCWAQKHKTKIIIIKIVNQPALDSVETTMRAQLEVLGYQDGVNARIDTHEVENERAKMISVLDDARSDSADLVIAISTPVAMAALNYANYMPVVFAAVTDPVAAGLCADMQRPDKNVTGTSDMAAVEKIMKLMLETLPESRRVGVLFNPNEANALMSAAQAREYCEAREIACDEAYVETAEDIAVAAQRLVKSCDAIFEPADNTVGANAKTLSEICVRAEVPLFTAMDAMVSAGEALASVSVHMGELGRETANIADKVLRGTPVKDIPVVEFTNFSTFINVTAAKKIGILFSDTVLTTAVVYE